MTLHDKALAPENKDLLQWIPPVVAVSLALAVIALMGGQSVTFGDAGDYVEAARALLKGQPYPRVSSLPFFRPPLYPMMISVVWLMFPGSYLAIKLAQAALFGGTCWLLYQLGWSASNNRGAALTGRSALSGVSFRIEVAAQPWARLLVTGPGITIRSSSWR